MHSVHMSSFRVLTKQRSRKSYKLGELNGDNKLSAYEITKKNTPKQS